MCKLKGKAKNMECWVAMATVVSRGCHKWCAGTKV